MQGMGDIHPITSDTVFWIKSDWSGILICSAYDDLPDQRNGFFFLKNAHFFAAVGDPLDLHVVIDMGHISAPFGPLWPKLTKCVQKVFPHDLGYSPEVVGGFVVKWCA